MDLHALLRATIDMRAVSDCFDAMSPLERVHAAASLTRVEQAALYDAAKGFKPITVDTIVPPDLGTLRPVIHYGKNSLALFTRFQKRFCRVGEPHESKRELVGYNHQLMSLFTGPGYYVAYDIPNGEVLIDYTRVPEQTVPGWPRVISNAKRLARWIYNGTKDTLRGVSDHVTIGRAARAGVDMPNWFVLCREDVVRQELPAPKA